MPTGTPPVLLVALDERGRDRDLGLVVVFHVDQLEVADDFGIGLLLGEIWIT